MRAVAIPYVIALILGVIVVGIIGYWFVVQGGKTVGVGATAECDALCSSWKISAFNVKPVNIEKVCPKFSEVQLKVFCGNKFECDLADTSCSNGETNYGINIRSGLPVCCKS